MKNLDYIKRFDMHELELEKKIQIRLGDLEAVKVVEDYISKRLEYIKSNSNPIPCGYVEINVISSTDKAYCINKYTGYLNKVVTKWIAKSLCKEHKGYIYAPKWAIK